MFRGDNHPNVEGANQMTLLSAWLYALLFFRIKPNWLQGCTIVPIKKSEALEMESLNRRRQEIQNIEKIMSGIAKERGDFYHRL